MEPTAGPGQLLAISDLHISYPENRALVEQLHPTGEEDWLIVAGDIAETVEDIRWTLATLAARFRKVLWTPGNHDLWTHPKDPVQLRGVARYEHLVQVCRELGVLTPEDPYPVWQGPGGPVAVAPLFLGYDYSFLPAWCRERVARTEERLAALPPDLPTVLANHYPLHRHPTEVLWHPEFAMWCGTELTADWHRRFRVATMVYGHLHIPRTTWHDGVRFTEVSVGYPREWRKRSQKPGTARRILPMEEVEAGDRGAAPGVGRGRGGTS